MKKKVNKKEFEHKKIGLSGFFNKPDTKLFVGIVIFVGLVFVVLFILNINFSTPSEPKVTIQLTEWISGSIQDIEGTVWIEEKLEKYWCIQDTYYNSLGKPDELYGYPILPLSKCGTSTVNGEITSFCKETKGEISDIPRPIIFDLNKSVYGVSEIIKEFIPKEHCFEEDNQIVCPIVVIFEGEGLAEGSFTITQKFDLADINRGMIPPIYDIFCYPNEGSIEVFVS